MEEFRDGLFGPTIILFVICLVFTFALAFVNRMTAPIIAQGQITALNEVRSKVLPAAESFTEIAGVKFPEGVSEVYRADNGMGFVFRSAAKGFAGNVTFIVGVDMDGKITGIEMFEHDETPGLGSKVADRNFLQNWYGDADPSSVDGITGATRTTNALRNALIRAKEAYMLVKEGQNG